MNKMAQYSRSLPVQAFLVGIVLMLALAPSLTAAPFPGVSCKNPCCAPCRAESAPHGLTTMPTMADATGCCRTMPDAACDLSRSPISTPAAIVFSAAMPSVSPGGVMIVPKYVSVAGRGAQLRRYCRVPLPPSSFPPLFLTQNVLLY